jgi:hypothetical protein
MSEEPLDRPGPGAVFAFDVSDAEREALRDELRRAAAQETGFASRRRLEELLTDAAAVALVLERNRLAAKRRGRAALVRAAADPAAARTAAELASVEERLEAEAGELRELMKRVRARTAKRA